MQADRFDILANEDRRRLLWRLEESGENAVSIPDDVHRGERPEQALHAAMHHGHLPKLRSAGYVRWDRDRDVVRRGPAFEELQPLIEALRDFRD